MGMNALEVRRRVILAQPHEAEAVGAVASFRTDVLSPLKMSFDLAPIQNLNGQSNPYPPGGGKNLADFDKTFPLTNANVQITDFGTDRTFSACTITVFCTNVVYTNPGNTLIRLRDSNNNDVTITTNELGMTANTTLNGAYSVTKTNVTFQMASWIYYSAFTSGSMKIQIESGSTATPFAPYSNICPITGHDGFTRVRTGKNLFDQSQLLLATGWQLNSDGYYNGNRSSFSNAFSTGFPKLPKFKANTRYTLSFVAYNSDALSGTYIRFIYSDGTNSLLNISGTTQTEYTLISSVGKTIVNLEGTYGSSGNVITYFKDMQLEEGTAKTDFTPYTGTSYTTTFPTPPGTVYGGHVTDNGDGTYDLAVKWYKYTADGSSNVKDVNLYRNGLYYVIIDTNLNPKGINTPNTGEPHLMSNVFDAKTVVAIGYTYITGNGGFLVAVLPDQTATTVALATQWFANNPTDFVYELETPIQYTGLSLTALQSIIGQNNIWVDNADSVAVEYWGH